MSNIVAIVQTVTGLVKAVSEVKGERTLQPGDAIYDDDVITSSSSGSRLTTNTGFSIGISKGEQWLYAQSGFVETTNNQQDTSAELKVGDNQLSADIKNRLDDNASGDAFANDNAHNNKTLENRESIAPINEGGIDNSVRAGNRALNDGGFNDAFRVDGQSIEGRIMRGSENVVTEFSNVIEQDQFNNNGITLGSALIYSSYKDDFIGFKKAFYSLLAGGRIPTLNELLNLDVQRIDIDNINAVQGNIIRNINDGVDIDNLNKLQDIADIAIDILTRIISAANNNNNASSIALTLDDFDRIGIINIDDSNLQQIFSVFNQENITGINVNTVPKIQELVDAYNNDLSLIDSMSGITDVDLQAELISENAAIGTPVGITALAIEGGGDGITYSLSSNPGSLFSIDSSTGIVTLAGNLDYETAISHMIDITATSSDGTSRVGSFTISVSNSGVDVGLISDTNATLSTVSENAIVGTLLGITAFAEDLNAADTVTYTLSATDIAAGLFSIDAMSGVVTLIEN